MSSRQTMQMQTVWLRQRHPSSLRVPWPWLNHVEVHPDHLKNVAFYVWNHWWRNNHPIIHLSLYTEDPSGFWHWVDQHIMRLGEGMKKRRSVTRVVSAGVSQLCSPFCKIRCLPSLPKSSNYLVRKCLDPLKAFSGEGPNTYSQGIWKDWGIEDMFGLFFGNGEFHQNIVLSCCSPLN